LTAGWFASRARPSILIVSTTGEERTMEKQSPSNHGEGNPEAADHFNSAEQEFVNSKRGNQKIREGAQVRPEEEADLANAEKIGRDHAKYDDATSQPKK
jgi:hypothetical protein